MLPQVATWDTIFGLFSHGAHFLRVTDREILYDIRLSSKYNKSGQFARKKSNRSHRMIMGFYGPMNVIFFVQ